MIDFKLPRKLTCDFEGCQENTLPVVITDSLTGTFRLFRFCSYAHAIATLKKLPLKTMPPPPSLANPHPRTIA